MTDNVAECPRCNDDGLIIHFEEPDSEGNNKIIVPWIIVEKMVTMYLDKTINDMLDAGSL